MLFSSQTFIFIFLPTVLITTSLIARSHLHRHCQLFLVIASLYFYSYTNQRDVVLILATIAANYFLAYLLTTPNAKHRTLRRRTVLPAGIVLNLLLLGYYKYSAFFLSAFGINLGLMAKTTTLPLGISFFTFQQIAYLVDTAKKKAERTSFLSYTLFISFFPQLIAGPIVHHNDLLPQLRTASFKPTAKRLLDGGTYFLIGLFKKVVLADQLGTWADLGFDAANENVPLGFAESWSAALAYYFQIYFDFSGYSDMAIGLARCFGLNLPTNFQSPYKSKSITEFWRRWHITLSHFLRDYIYIPLGGNRLGLLRKVGHLLLTMTIGGLWHGAGWTFVAWGFLHGCLLSLETVTNKALKNLTPPATTTAIRLPLHFAQLTYTALALIFTWVLFRADTFNAATVILRGMCGLNGFAIPKPLVAFIPSLPKFVDTPLKIDFLAHGSLTELTSLAGYLLLSIAITQWTPALSEIRLRTRVCLIVPTLALSVSRIITSPQPNEFIYFKF